MRLTTCPRCKQTTPDDINCYHCNFPEPKKVIPKKQMVETTPLSEDDDEFFD